MLIVDALDIESSHFLTPLLFSIGISSSSCFLNLATSFIC